MSQFFEGEVCGDEQGTVLVAAADELEEEVCGSGVVGEVAEFVDDEQRGPGVVAESSFECARGLLSVAVEQQVGGGAEEGGVSCEDGLVCDVLGEHGLPSPCAPTRMTFSPRARKSRVRMRSRTVRSSAAGQFQSQSASGLNRPSLAQVSLRSTLRRCRSSRSAAARCSSSTAGLQRFRVACAMRSLRSSAVRTSPRRRSSVASVVGAVFSEGIVGLQVMGPHVEVPQFRAVGQGESEGRFLSSPSASGFEDVGDGPGAEGVLFEGDGDGGVEFAGSVVVEQGEQSGGVWPQGFAALGEALEEGVGGGDGGSEAVAGGVGVGLAGRGEQPFEMGGVLDGPSGVVAAPVGGPVRSSRRGCGCGRRRRPGRSTFPFSFPRPGVQGRGAKW